MSRNSAIAPATLVALLTLGGVASAGQTLTGTYIEANYADNGMWNWSSTGQGLLYTTTSTGLTQDATYPGSPWTHFQVEYDQSSSSYDYQANSTASTTITVNSESNASDSATLISVYEYTAGDLEVTKIEYWEVDGTVISQQFLLENTGSSDITNLRFQMATDPDHDVAYYGTYNTLNDVDDLDGDGTADWVVSMGPSSGIAFGFAPCDPDSASLGHSAGWDQDADLAMTDYGFGSGDYSMNWVHTEGTLAAGASTIVSNLVVFGDDLTTAEGLVVSEADLCGICDADGDGSMATWCGGDDCDDNSASTYPGADEYCNSVDDDCDGTIDEDDALDAVTWYADSDSDSYGDPAISDIDCDQPSGYVADNTDCDDTVATTYPGADEYCNSVDDDCDGVIDEDSAIDVATWYEDGDSDGYGSTTVTDIDCDQPTGYVSDNTDCDDTVATTYPGADEYCNLVDDDCDGDIDEDTAVDAVTWYVDVDGDGYGEVSVTDIECYQPSGFVADSTDCDDARAATYPGAPEYCNFIDDDCDGDIDEDDAVDVVTWYVDQDSDGYGDAALFDVDCNQPSGMVEDDTDCDDYDDTVYPGAPEVEYDGIDQDCDGEDLCDVDLDTFNAVECGGDDCDDADEDVNVDAAEVWYDGIDQDCDELSDYDSDYDGYDSESYGGDDCDDADPDTYPGAPDEYYDGVINDCDDADEYDADGDGQDAAEYGGEDCDDANSDVNTESPEVWYDGVDQDCDGEDDDQDGDGYMVDEDCDDLDADSFPGSEGLDDNCDSVVDESLDGLSGDTGSGIGLDGATGGGGAACAGTKTAATFAFFSLLGLGLGSRRRRED
jgi:hypothetical protein